MDACQPTQLMTITNFVIVISLCAQSNLLICRDEDRSGCGHRARVDALGQAGLTSRP
jgi:hypothetical protein